MFLAAFWTEIQLGLCSAQNYAKLKIVRQHNCSHVNQFYLQYLQYFTYNTIRYDTIRYDTIYLYVRPKADDMVSLV